MEEQRSPQHQSKQTAAELEADSSMFDNSFGKEDNAEQEKQEEVYNYRKQNTLLHNRLTHFQQQHRNANNNSNNFDTYPPKRNYFKKPPQNNSLSTGNILQTTSGKRAMSSSHNSPLKTTNTTTTTAGRFYKKRSTKRSFSESSAEKLHRYTTSDSSSSQEEDELMMSSVDKRKMNRRSLSASLQHQKYQHILSRSQRTSQSFEAGEDDDGGVVGCSKIFGKNSQYVSDMIDIGIRVILVVVFR